MNDESYINPEKYAFPKPELSDEVVWEGIQRGMTLRAYFAAKAMQGMLADPDCAGSCAQIAESSVKCADALIAELNKEAAQ